MSIFNSNSLLISTNQEYRCPKCFFIPFISFSFSTEEKKIFMITNCTNNHSFSKPVDEMEIMCKTSLSSNNNCVNCDKKKIFLIFTIIV